MPLPTTHPHHSISSLRQLLAEPPSWDLWNRIVAFLDQWPGEEDVGLAVEYVRSHLETSWPQRWRQGNQQWSENSRGWALLRREEKPIVSLPQATEVWCPPGSHKIKSFQNSAWTHDWFEVPLKRGLWVMKTQVTDEMWHTVKFPSHLRSILHVEGRDNHSDRCPARNLSWLEAVVFCNLVSELEGVEPAYEILWPEREPSFFDREQLEVETKVTFLGVDSPGYRLPCELEWEVLARAGSLLLNYGTLDEIAWYNDNSEEVSPVGLKKPNAWGLYDTIGNVCELCTDTTHDPEFLPSEMELQHVRCQPSDAFVMDRGGSHGCDALCCEVSTRSSFERYERDKHVGFRMVRTCWDD